MGDWVMGEGGPKEEKQPPVEQMAAAIVRSKMYAISGRGDWDYLQHTTIWWDYADIAVAAAVEALLAAGFTRPT